MKLLKWIAFHRIPARWLSLGLVFLFTLALAFLDVPFLVLMIIYFGLMLIVYIFVEAYAPLFYQRKDITSLLDNCDPFPLLHSSEELLSANISNGTKDTIITNYCVALRNIGEYEKAYGFLTGLDVDNMSEKMNVNKLLIYNNLADLCILLERFDEAIEYHDKFDNIYKTVKKEMIATSLRTIAENHLIDRLYINGDYLGALELIKKDNPIRPESKINTALYCAKIYIKLDDREKAEEKLNYVIANGNRLFAVVEAKRMLENLDGNS